MEYKQRVHVIEIKIDAPLPEVEFVQISLGFKLETKNPRGTGQTFKHSIHIYIPKHEWKSQYKMWDEYDLTVSNSGNLTLKKISGGE